MKDGKGTEKKVEAEDVKWRVHLNNAQANKVCLHKCFYVYI